MLGREEVTDIGEEIFISQDFNKAKGARIQSAGERSTGVTGKDLSPF